MIDINHVSKTYGNGKKAVNDLTMQISDGTVFGFLGPNGAGKSTTIKMLVGLLKEDSGTIAIGGKQMRDDPVAVKKAIGYVPDEPLFYDKMTAWQYIAFIADVYAVQDWKARAEELAKTFTLHALDDDISSFSHGMKQKLAVICALLHKPHLLILDEPMVGLDPSSSHTLKQVMASYAKEGNIVFFSTHVLEVAQEVCTEVGIIDHGKLLCKGPFATLKANQDENLEQFFLNLTEDDHA